MQLVEGVPGCGKTTSIINKHNRNKDLILTATKETKEEYLNIL